VAKWRSDEVEKDGWKVEVSGAYPTCQQSGEQDECMGAALNSRELRRVPM
jgi:hypothetical protein